MGSRFVIAMLAASSLLTSGRVPPLLAQRRALARPSEPLIATPLHAVALNDLSFGTVLPGIPLSVPVGDPRAGEFEILGSVGESVRVEFGLPLALIAHDGSLLPLTFGSSDGFASFSRGHAVPGFVFNPQAPVITTLGPDGRLFLRMGASVFPGRPQAAGSYRATITLTVFDLGS